SSSPARSDLLSQRALGGARQRTAGELARQVSLVLDRPALVGRRLALLGGEHGRLGERLLRRRTAREGLLGARGCDAPTDGGQRDPRAADPAVVEPQLGAGGRDRPVAGAALDLLVGAAGVLADRDPHLREQLTGADGGLVGAAGEVGHRDDALARRAADDEARAERGADGGEILRRVGLAEGAADRAAVAHG